MRFVRLVVEGALVGLVALGAAAEACSSSSSPAAPATCEAAPFACAAGTTCWPKDCTCPSGVPDCGVDICTPHLECLPSLAGKNPHDTCNDTIGSPTCSDLQTCVEFQANHGGCLTYCDSTHPCTGVETCISTQVGQTADGPTIHVCAVVGNGDGGVPDGSGDDEILDAAGEGGHGGGELPF